MKRRIFLQLLLMIAIIASLFPLGSKQAVAAPMTSRYTLSNEYVMISGTNGQIDTLKVSPNGSGIYGDNVIKNGHYFYMSTWIDSEEYIGKGHEGTWSLSGNTLSLNNIQFGSTGLKGDWMITLVGDTLQSSYTIKNTTHPQVNIHSSRLKLEVPFDAEGYDVSDNTKIYFSKFITSTDLYIDARGLKRLESDPSLIFRGEWIHAFGTNGYDLRFFPETEILQPINRIAESVQELAFGVYNYSQMKALAKDDEITQMLSMQVYPKDLFTLPDSYPVFTSSNAYLADSLNTILYERNFGWNGAGTSADWKEWMLLSRSWIDSYVRDSERNELLGVQVPGEILNPIQLERNGSVWAWWDKAPWSFGGAKHELTTSANLINGSYRYFMATGDAEFLKLNIERMRKAMTFMLEEYYSSTDKIFIVTNGLNRGVSGSGASNYYDLTPYGYKDAYGNIYAYLALRNMAEIENLLGNSTRGTELTNYANDVKIGYNNEFWNGHVYVQTIDDQGMTHNYDATYLNFEAITYGLADAARASSIIDYFTNKVTPSGSADVFSKWIIAPRSLATLNPPRALGGWWAEGNDPQGDYNSQLQHGGADFYVAFYELMSRIIGKGPDDAYLRLNQIIDRFNQPDHLSGGNPLYNGEINQHLGEGQIGVWGEFPESGLVPAIGIYGLLGIEMDSSGLHITPKLPNGLDSFGIEKFNYWDMNLKIDVTDTSVKIKAMDNQSPYNWNVNNIPVSGLFDITVPIAKGNTVTLQRSPNNDFDLDMISSTFVKLKFGEWTDVLSNTHTWEHYQKMNEGLNVLTIPADYPHNPFIFDTSGGVIGEFTLPDGRIIYTDSSWKVSPEYEKGWANPDFDDSGWSNAISYGDYGVSPWNEYIPGMGGTNGKWIWSSLNQSGYSQIPVVSANASSSLVDWPASNAFDDNPATSWSSLGYPDSENTEWISFDLGEAKDVRQVSVVPRLPAGYGYPSDFQIEWSHDGIVWHPIAAQRYENYPHPGTTEQVYTFNDPVHTRYIRIYATKLAADNVGSYYMQIADVKIYEMKIMPSVLRQSPLGIKSSEASSVENAMMDTSKAHDKDTSTIWSSAYRSSANATEWISFDFGKVSRVGGLILQPRINGYGFPVDFSIQSSNDGVNWSNIPGQTYTNYINNGNEDQIFSFSSAINTRYIRIYATRLSPDDYNGYYFQLVEAQFYPEPVIQYSTGLASSMVWPAMNALDNDLSTSWSSNGHSSANATEWVAVDFKESRRIDEIHVTARQPDGMSFPVDFKFQYSQDGSTWIDIPGLSFTNFPNPKGGKLTFKLDDPIFSRYIRMYATKLSSDGYYYYAQISELFAGTANRSYLRKLYYSSIDQVSTSGAVASSVANTTLSASNVNDQDSQSIWSSKGHTISSKPEWIYVDAGSVKTIKQIDLVPEAEGLGFPIDFKFQYSLDAVNWVDINGLSYTHYGNPGNNLAQTFAIQDPVEARYIRLYMTKLGLDGNGLHASQIAEMKLYK